MRKNELLIRTVAPSLAAVITLHHVAVVSVDPTADDPEAPPEVVFLTTATDTGVAFDTVADKPIDVRPHRIVRQSDLIKWFD